MTNELRSQSPAPQPPAISDEQLESMKELARTTGNHVGVGGLLLYNLCCEVQSLRRSTSVPPVPVSDEAIEKAVEEFEDTVIIRVLRRDDLERGLHVEPAELERDDERRCVARSELLALLARRIEQAYREGGTARAVLLDVQERAPLIIEDDDLTPLPPRAAQGRDSERLERRCAELYAEGERLHATELLSPAEAVVVLRYLPRRLELAAPLSREDAVTYEVARTKLENVGWYTINPARAARSVATPEEE